MSEPTAAELKAAGLVEVTTSADIVEAATHGYPPHTWDATTEKFLLQSTAYVSTKWKAPVSTPAITSSVIGALYFANGV